MHDVTIAEISEIQDANIIEESARCNDVKEKQSELLTTFKVA